MTPLEVLLSDHDKFFSGGNSWQGGLYQLVEPLSLEQALWKPSPDRHCIWDVLLHINFWKQRVIAVEKNMEKPDIDSGNWSLPPEKPTIELWKKELERTIRLQEELKDVIKVMDERVFNTEENITNHIRQIISHDAYHAGQIGLLRVMQGLKPIE